MDTMQQATHISQGILGSLSTAELVFISLFLRGKKNEESVCLVELKHNTAP